MSLSDKIVNNFLASEMDKKCFWRMLCFFIGCPGKITAGTQFLQDKLRIRWYYKTWLFFWSPGLAGNSWFSEYLLPRAVCSPCSSWRTTPLSGGIWYLCGNNIVPNRVGSPDHERFHTGWEKKNLNLVGVSAYLLRDGRFWAGELWASLKVLMLSLGKDCTLKYNCFMGTHLE